MASCGCGSFVTAAFRSCNQNEAYIFLNNKFVVDNYCPHTANDKIVNGPSTISEGMPCLKGTVFANGINSAFAAGCTGTAYIFSDGCCALLNYSPCCPSKASLIKGPMPISQMFPFLKNTIFETGMDAAFESSVCNEAYLFKGDQYARINFDSCKPSLMNQGPIAKFWPCLKGTMFEINIGAAFQSHCYNEAYLFKGEYYARIKFTPGATNDQLLGVSKIKDCWPNLGKLLPQPTTN